MIKSIFARLSSTRLHILVGYAWVASFAIAIAPYAIIEVFSLSTTNGIGNWLKALATFGLCATFSYVFWFCCMSMWQGRVLVGSMCLLFLLVLLVQSGSRVQPLSYLAGLLSLAHCVAVIWLCTSGIHHLSRLLHGREAERLVTEA